MSAAEENKIIAEAEAAAIHAALPSLRKLGSDAAAHQFIDHLRKDLLALEAHLYPAQFHFTPECRELAARASDLGAAWMTSFGSAGAHLAVSQHVELLAKLLFAYFSAAGRDGAHSTRVVAAFRAAPHKDGECDAGLLVDEHFPVTVDCKAVFEDEHGHFVVRNEDEAMAATHGLFVAIWRSNIAPDAVFHSAEECLAAVSRVVFVDIEALPKQEQDDVALSMRLDAITEASASEGVVRVVCGADRVDSYAERAVVCREGAKIVAWACELASRPQAVGSSPHAAPRPDALAAMEARAEATDKEMKQTKNKDEEDEDDGGC